MNNRTCVVTGGAGFIGCALSAELARRFSRVIAVDCLHPQVHATSDRPQALAAGIELIKEDVTNAWVWDDLLSTCKPDTVVHLAAETGTGQSLTKASRHANVNVLATAQMLDSFVRHNVIPRCIVLTSSRAVYGEGAWLKQDGSVIYPRQRTLKQLQLEQWNFPNARPLQLEASKTIPYPSSIYGATKLAQEHMLSAWTKAFGAQLVVLRLQNVYGPGQSLFNPYTGIASLFCRLAKQGKSIPLYEDGAMLRDFVMIEDVASAILKALEPCIQEGTYDIGSGNGVSIGAVAKLIAHKYGAPAPHICKAYRHGDVRHATCNIGPAIENLHWSPVWKVEDGLAKLCDWIDDQLDEEEQWVR
jgi:dTDP-L-rhamnose 4-epimerase